MKPNRIDRNLLRPLNILKNNLDGELFIDQTMRTIYATDASVYREFPLAVAIPKNDNDLKQLIAFAQHHRTSLIPRAGGTSLAGQCVGNGIVVDISKHFNKILEVNKEEKWVRLQAGIIRDDLNLYLKPYGLFFGPNTSTSNRAMIGGMIGNNSSGSYSIVYGTTRDHVLSMKALLSDGSEVEFKDLTKGEFRRKCIGNTLENQIYRQINNELSRPDVRENIKNNFPKPQIHRRNTGYAVDVLLESNAFNYDGDDFNFCKLLTGSEGTLAFTTEIKLNLNDLPPKEKALMCVHFKTVDEALRAVPSVMKYSPRAVELMDKIVLDCTKDNIEQRQNRFFIKGEPEAILIIELGGNTQKAIDEAAKTLHNDLKIKGLGYHFPMIYPPQVERVWKLRKAGLGLLANLKGDAKPVTCIEDTAVTIEDLPNYIADFTEIMKKYDQRAVYYAHAGAGELHLRPILNLKKSKDRQLFYDISKETALLVKKYGGSLSGEHGDGRVRAEFIPLMIGEKNYDLLKRLKATWDKNNIFNPNKIVDAKPMNKDLRYESDQETKQFNTVFDFSEQGGILRAAEKCNGSGDCRKSHLAGGTMCPSYMATRNEKDTTRARANVLREVLTRSDKENPFEHEEIKEVMDLCLSCKACTSECPSNVDMSTLKAEFLHQYYQKNGVPFRAKFFANFSKLNNFGAMMPSLSNFFLKNSLTSAALKKIVGIAPKRSIPLLYKTTLRKWFKAWEKTQTKNTNKRKVYLFCDEFTNLSDTRIGIKAVELLAKLGYEVKMIAHEESGRTFLSKGLLKEAQAIARKNVAIFAELISEKTPLLGIEPSAILSFRDEYPKLVAENEREKAKVLGENCLMIEEFLAKEMENEHLSADLFTKTAKNIKLHGHCHQKSLSSVSPAAFLLALPQNYSVEVIPSGCCGMAGSFGYEAEHYEVSMQVGELVLFPAVRKASNDTIIAAAGTSCRHQIFDGTKRVALHPVEVLWEAVL